MEGDLIAFERDAVRFPGADRREHPAADLEHPLAAPLDAQLDAGKGKTEALDRSGIQHGKAQGHGWLRAGGSRADRHAGPNQPPLAPRPQPPSWAKFRRALGATEARAGLG